MAVTLFICHVGYEVAKDVVHRLADGVDPAVARERFVHVRRAWLASELPGPVSRGAAMAAVSP